MSPFRKAGIALTMGALVVAGSALGGGLLSAGAATTGPSGPTQGAAPGTFHSNEARSHDSSEPATREQAEGNGTAAPGAPGGAFHPNENKSHEGSEDPTRESAEHSGAGAPAPGAPDAAPPASSGSGTGTGI
jgi:hypothetical protein